MVINKGLKADIVKIPSHGDIAFSEGLLKSTEPKITVVTNGEILDNNILLSLFTTETYSTFQYGTITFVTDGNTYSIKKEKSD